MVAAQRGVDVDKARGPVKLALKKMVASNLVKQLKVGFPFSHGLSLGLIPGLRIVITFLYGGILVA